MSDSVIATKKKHNRFGLIQLFIVLGLLAIVGVSFGVNVLPKKYAGVPEKLGGMKVECYRRFGSDGTSQPTPWRRY